MVGVEYHHVSYTKGYAIEIYLDWNFLVGVGDTQLGQRVLAQPCEEIWESIILWYCVHGPFMARGAQGKEEYP